MWEWVLGGALTWVAADALVFTPYAVEFNRVPLRVRRVPPGLAGKRILHLSDLHVGGWTYRELFVRHVVETSAPDLIVITGDLLSSGRGIPTVLDLLGHISAPLGVWFVPGNNEIEELIMSPFIHQLEDLGIETLLNQGRAIGEGWSLVGVNDPSLEKDDLARALRSVPPEDFKLLLAHSPEIIYQAADWGVDVVLCGHTHGGQVRVPWAGALYADTQRTGLRYVQGRHEVRGTVMSISRGLGMSKLPIRWNCPPEVLEYTLLPR